MENNPVCTKLENKNNTLKQQIKEMQRDLNRLRGNEEKYRTILETIEEGYYEVDLSGNFTFLNDAMARIIGYSKKEMIGMNNREYADAETARKVYKVFNNVFRTGIPDKGFDWEFISNNGIKRHVETSIALIKNDNRDAIGFQGLLRDVTKRKTAEKSLLASEEKYRTILETIEEGYYEVDLSGNLTFFNPVICKILGYSPDEILGMNNREFSDPETTARVYEVFNNVYKTGMPDKGFDWTFIRKDNTKLQVETSISLQRDTNGVPVGFRGILRDVDERK